jgi:peptidoglycan/xylan/chitin deacetylase (PgdA/CDA1 family)
MESRYLVRFDDICPSMNWAVWEAIERELVLHQVRPILAVVPDNRDPKLMCDTPVPDFWDRVRRWQQMGFSIALHGYQHVYVNHEKGLIRLNPQSEFAGLSFQIQEAKLKAAMAIFAKEGVRADAWVAPSHSFDRTTLQVLSSLGVKVISDGLWPWPHMDADRLFWVPQQLWDFAPKPAGIWTVCCHHNAWTEQRVESFGKQLASYAPQMTDLATITKDFSERPLTLSDRLSAFRTLLWRHRIRPVLGGVWRRWVPSRP